MQDRRERVFRGERREEVYNEKQIFYRRGDVKNFI